MAGKQALACPKSVFQQTSRLRDMERIESSRLFATGRRAEQTRLKDRTSESSFKNSLTIMVSTSTLSLVVSIFFCKYHQQAYITHAPRSCLVFVDGRRMRLRLAGKSVNLAWGRLLSLCLDLFGHRGVSLLALKYRAENLQEVLELIPPTQVQTAALAIHILSVLVRGMHVDGVS